MSKPQQTAETYTIAWMGEGDCLLATAPDRLGMEEIERRVREEAKNAHEDPDEFWDQCEVESGLTLTNKRPENARAIAYASTADNMADEDGHTYDYAVRTA